MLPCACFRDDATLAHFLREQSLAKGVVDLVRASVQQVFALQKNTRAARVLSQTRSKIERRWPAAVVAAQIGKLLLECTIVRRRQIRCREFLEGSDERFGNEAAAIRAQ